MCDPPTNERLRMLADIRASEAQQVWQVSTWMKENGRLYSVFAFAEPPSGLSEYKPGQMFWTSYSALVLMNMHKCVILDDLSQPVYDIELARRLFRAAAVRYKVLHGSRDDLELDPEDVQYVRSMTANPVFMATFVAQGVKSAFTSPADRYRAFFLDMLLADTDAAYIKPDERKALTQVLESGKDINDALQVFTKVAWKLPSNYVKKLDENRVLIRRGQVWRREKRMKIPDIEITLLAGLAEVLVELTHNQVVLKERAQKLQLGRYLLLRNAPSGTYSPMRQALDEALAWSGKAYKDGHSNAVDKLVEVAKREGPKVALKLIAKLSGKANTLLLGFDIPETIFSMDNMYDANLKAQCAADVFAAATAAIPNAIARAEGSTQIRDWETVEALYLIAYISTTRFHHYASEMLTSSDVGTAAGDLLTQGKTRGWIRSQKLAETQSRRLVDYWQDHSGIAGSLRLMTTEIALNGPAPASDGLRKAEISDQAVQKVMTNSVGMKLVWIPPGEFDMGSDKGHASERPVHRVKISKGFWMGQTEVTQAQYKVVMETEPWSGKRVQQSDSNPTVYVSWNDAVEFCRKLSQLEGRMYRLPTEAEWEYACRAGTTTRFSFGDSESLLSDYAWFQGNAGGVGEWYAHPVGQKKPNAWGLFDMHGNVCEWCGDLFAMDYYSKSPSIDPQGPSTGEYLGGPILRGGSWHGDPEDCQSAIRTWSLPDTRVGYDGFRIVLDLN